MMPLLQVLTLLRADQTIISRRLNPMDVGVITIGSFDGKSTFNVIKDSMELKGDIRYMTVETKETIEKEVKRIVKGIEVEFGVTCEFILQIIRLYTTTLNIQKRLLRVYEV